MISGKIAAIKQVTASEESRGVKEPVKSLRKVPPTIRYEAQPPQGTLPIPGFRPYMFVCGVTVRFWIVAGRQSGRGRGAGEQGKQVEDGKPPRGSQGDDGDQMLAADESFHF